MNRAVALVAWACAAVCGQAMAATGCETSEAALLRIEEAWRQALVSADEKQLRSIVSADYVDTSETGARVGLPQLLAVLRSRQLRIRRLEFSAMQVQFHGGSAIVSGRATQLGEFGPLPLPQTVSFTDSFACIRGAWIAVAAHRSVVTTAPPSAEKD